MVTSLLSARGYRSAWVAVAGASGFTGLLLGVVLTGTWSLVMILATATCLAVACCAAAEDLADRPVRLLPLVALLTAVFVAGTGLVLALGGAAVALLVCLAVTGLPLLGPRHRFLDTAELRGRWEAGARALAEASTPGEAAAVVRDRARCLDELERRDPDGVRRWLSSPDPSARFGSTDPA
ncbi:hypothetical protein L6E12_31685 [Actinokineospora sp. PR83]|uniref:hypothetical protein n=1 Tax=Actinokineospora sp. PR83 TaxID=2884908 RepID=UPI001F44FBE4|nr:hypothetical protein [Actinokineospora sp. PR83]MCG8920338.1 hypothetical protein [Actinokineospora sp. PR83]